MTTETRVTKKQKPGVHFVCYFLGAIVTIYLILFLILPDRRFVTGSLLILFLSLLIEQIWFERHTSIIDFDYKLVRKKRILATIFTFIIWLIVLIAVFAFIISS